MYLIMNRITSISRKLSIVVIYLSSLCHTQIQAAVSNTNTNSAFKPAAVTDTIPATQKSYVDFNGINDYGNSKPLLGSLQQATIMSWIKLDENFNAVGMIAGQENFNLSVNAANRLVATANGQHIFCPFSLETNKWYHITAVYNSLDATEKLKLYINGKKEKTSNSSALEANLAESASKFTFAKNALSDDEFFKGSIDEIRVFNLALSDDMIQKMVYQEIKQQGVSIRGEVIPKNIDGLLWSNLIGYYKMNDFRTVGSNERLTSDEVSSETFVKLYNTRNFKPQSAPMPFITTRNGDIDIAVSDNNFVNGGDALSYDWSIVHIKNDVQFQYNHTSLGMIVDYGVKVTLTNENKLQNNWYLKLDGKIDCKGKSQLVQTQFSDLDPQSVGSIEKDQQGQTNKFNYNYWCSPVGVSNNTTNNADYTIAEVLKDGTDPDHFQNINWTTSVNGAPTSPITLSSFWIFKFQNLIPSMANWISVGCNGNVQAGQGFTLKGSGSTQPFQNYTFVGKPNNGDINVPIAVYNLNLTGNPYPSALDADKFIRTNLNSTRGSLYFWENSETNYTHNLIDYQGGYAVRNLVGGVPAMSLYNDNSASEKIPGKYIPVGQAFFMSGNGTGGAIKFNNSQRSFVKENNIESNLMFKASADGETQNNGNSVLNNSEDAIPQSIFPKIRLGFITGENYHRQILLGFMGDLATSATDAGFDALYIDTQPSDMYFIDNNNALVIQGEGEFDVNKIYPITVKSNGNGTLKFILDATENFDSQYGIYIYDNVTSEYHDIRTEAFELNLPVGTFANRFSLRFKTLNSLAAAEFNLNDEIQVAYTNANHMITIKNNVQDATVESVMVYNMIGQSIANFEVKKEIQTKIQIPVSNLSSGTYIIKVHTTKGDITKKVLVR